MKLWRRNITNDELPLFLKSGLTKCNDQLIKMANFLQRKTNGYSTRTKKLLLLLFVIVFVAESSIVTIQSFQGKNLNSISVTRIRTIPIERSTIAVPRVAKTELLKIQRFKNYIDSLSTTIRGRKLRDSLLHNRPHLMDTINFLINVYLEQSKKKENEKAKIK